MYIHIYLYYPRITLKAPNGVTKMGGANEYAEKFNISPIATKTIVRLY